MDLRRREDGEDVGEAEEGPGAEAWAPDGAGARLAVEDTGRGMDAATLARLGQPFYTTRAGGTGLGVLLARQVAEQHGGALSFTSTPWRGTTATVTLPAWPSRHADDPPV